MLTYADRSSYIGCLKNKQGLGGSGGEQHQLQPEQLLLLQLPPPLPPPDTSRESGGEQHLHQHLRQPQVAAAAELEVSQRAALRQLSCRLRMLTYADVC